jgi:glycosyltransferase involved in cell wall biosynthesis
MKELILSVIVPSYNSEAYLEECLASIECETQGGVEFILVDGASADRTMEIVEKYSHLFSHVISEKDNGQSDAFNKGFKLAKGKFLTWLNSDDVLCPGVMTPVLERLSVSQQDWLVANSVYLDEDGCVTRCCRSGGFEHFAVKRGLLNVFGPSTFFSKKLFGELGGFRVDFNYCMDTEYWWRIVDAGYGYERMPVYFWGLRLHANAKTANVLLEGETPVRMSEEHRIMAKKYYPNVTQKSRSRCALWARIWRILNLSYVRSYLDTHSLKGTSY